MFVLLQRYTFWSNSQPYSLPVIGFRRCLYYCKDTLFEAIHNVPSTNWESLSLFVLLQRYTFWSNSQHPLQVPKLFRCCLYYCKDTLFEAIHNCFSVWVSWRFVVCITAKIHFLKQFTTYPYSIWWFCSLFVLLQRYTFWSNSQLSLNLNFCCKCCLYYCKDTLFEAIHNRRSSSFNKNLVVCITAKIHFLKQFTTHTVSAL